MSRLPKISVIIPAYNHFRYLDQAIDSVLDQTYGNYEIIVVDDGSTDNTRQLVEGYGNSVRYIYQENRGLAGARNTGISAARGIFVAFLDADDYFEKDNLEKKISFLESHPEIDWAYSDWDYLDEDHHFLERGSIRWNYRGKKLKSALFEELLYNRNFISPCTVVAKKSVLEAVGYFDSDVVCQEDWDLWLRLSLKYPSYYIDEVLVHVVVHPDSLSKNFSKWVKGNALIVDKLNNTIPLEFPNRKRALAKLNADKYTYLGAGSHAEGETGKGLEGLFQVYQTPALTDEDLLAGFSCRN